MSDVLKLVITGLPRSGTTVLSEVFRQVPGLFSGFECGFLLYDRPIDFINPKAKYKVHYQILKNSWALTDRDVHYICKSRKWEEVYSKLIERSPKVRDKHVSLFDKTPYYMLHLKKVLKKINGVKVIVVLKDVRSLYWSYKKRGTLEAGLGHLKTLTDKFANTLLSYADKGKIFLLHYEDMCLKPEQEIKKVFDFLNLDFKCNYLIFNPEYPVNVYGQGIGNSHAFTYKNHLLDEDYDAISTLVKHPLFYFNISETYLHPETKHIKSTLLRIDFLKHRPKEILILLVGWIASTLNIQKIWISYEDGSATHLQFCERSDVIKVHGSVYPYIKGFRGKIKAEAIKNDMITFYYKSVLCGKEFVHIYEYKLRAKDVLVKVNEDSSGSSP